jgi:hypothetical protein
LIERSDIWSYREAKAQGVDDPIDCPNGVADMNRDDLVPQFSHDLQPVQARLAFI